jgi:hypothetical protein
MSDGPIPLIQPNQLEFVAEATDFSGILSDNLGNLGTDSDGFDQYLSDTVDLLSAAGTILDTLDGDLNAAIAVLPEFDTTAPADLAASLKSASDAADTVLSDFTQSVAPAPTQGTGTPPPKTIGCPIGTVVDGVTTGKPDPTPYPAIPGVAYNFTRTANAMCTDNAPQDVWLADEYETNSGPLHFSAKLDSGDPTIFSIVTVDSNQGGGQLIRRLYVRITPSKAGRFQATVTLTGLASGPEKDGVNATIVVAPKG